MGFALTSHPLFLNKVSHPLPRLLWFILFLFLCSSFSLKHKGRRFISLSTWLCCTCVSLFLSVLDHLLYITSPTPHTLLSPLLLICLPPWSPIGWEGAELGCDWLVEEQRRRRRRRREMLCKDGNGHLSPSADGKKKKRHSELAPIKRDLRKTGLHSWNIKDFLPFYLEIFVFSTFPLSLDLDILTSRDGLRICCSGVHSVHHLIISACDLVYPDSQRVQLCSGCMLAERCVQRHRSCVEVSGCMSCCSTGSLMKMRHWDTHTYTHTQLGTLA